MDTCYAGECNEQDSARMKGITRFGVSIDAALLRDFDALCAADGYATRSEAIRDLIRDALIARAAESGAGISGSPGSDSPDGGREMAGTLTLVYDHHKSDLSATLTAAQHDAHHLVLSTLHVHLDHDNCLEAIVLRGPAAELRSFSRRVLAIKGVKHGHFSLTATGREFS